MARFSTAGSPGNYSVSVLDSFRQVASPVAIPYTATVTALGGVLGGVEYALWVPQGARIAIGSLVAAGTYWVGFIRPQTYQTWNWVPGQPGYSLGTGVTNPGSMAGAQPTAASGYPGAGGISAYVDADQYTGGGPPPPPPPPPAPAHVWNGTQWVQCDAMVWTGSAWVPTRIA